MDADPTWSSRQRWKEMLLIAAITVAMLVPFAGRPFHIDDPLYLWIARQITAHPLDPYGFEVIWSPSRLPMHVEMQNPPLASYYIALCAPVVGWSEIGLHLAFMLPAVGVALGTYRLALRMCQRPVIASLAAVLTPAFAVCASTVMCDVVMLCFWVWATVLWECGLRTRRVRWLLLAGLLAGASAMSKYFGVALIPLLAAYSIWQCRRAGWWLAALGVPIAIIAAYELWTRHLYGHGMFSDAMFYSSNVTDPTWKLPPLTRGAIGLAFLGGSAASAFWFSLRMLRGAALIAAGWFLVIAVLILAFIGHWGRFDLSLNGSLRWGIILQSGLWITVGAGVLALAVDDARRTRDSQSVLLLLWVFGTFVFSTYLNWAVNARTMLPTVPAVGILLARRLNLPTAGRALTWRDSWPLIPAAMLALAVAWGDYSLACTERDAARHIGELPRAEGSTLWYQGHWGLHWYMDRVGGKPVDYQTVRFHTGDLVVVPLLNAYVYSVPGPFIDSTTSIRLQPARWVATMSRFNGAGFHASIFGPLPFVFDAIPPDQYECVLIRVPTSQPDQGRPSSRKSP